MLYAIIDIGSSTIRMAIYNMEYGKIEMLMKKKHTVGLAAYVKDNIMQQKGIDSACDILNEFRDFLADFHISNVSAFTTAAIRNVKNSQEVIDELHKRTTIPIRIITGDEEAAFDFIGVMQNIAVKSGLIIDVGGGSTEIIHYENAAIIKKVSIPSGALSLHTKYAEDFLPSNAEINDMAEDIKNSLTKISDFSAVKAPYICGIGGTIKSLRLLYNHIFGCSEDNMSMDTSAFTSIIEKYTRDTNLSEENIITLLKTAPDRLQTIIPGIVIVNTICSYFKAEKLVYSDTGMREGFIYDQIIGQK